jgi:imidazolonepropionase-like amidohydrolase
MQPGEQNAYSRSGISSVSPFSRASSMETIMSQTGSMILGPTEPDVSFITPLYSAAISDALLLITAARLFDGAARVRPARVLIEGERIAAVGEAARAPDGTPHVEFGGASILPGLIDCHVHLVDEGLADATARDREPGAMRALRTADHARRTLEAGFTSVRDVGGRDHIEFGVRMAAGAGLIRAPRMRLAGKIVSQTTAGARMWQGMYREADGPWDAVKAVREQIAAGADLIKVMATGAVLAPGHERPGAAQLSSAELRAVVEAAHRSGVHVAAHAHGIDGIRNAVEAGVDTIEHGTHLHEDRGLASAMARRGIFLVPTLKALGYIADPPGPGVPEEIVAKARERRADRDATFKAARENGVPVAMGTDAATPFNRHGENAEELELMVALGMTPEQAIAAASSIAAAAVRSPDVGTLALGKYADIAIWDGDPLSDITALRSAPRAVYLGGLRVA